MPDPKNEMDRVFCGEKWGKLYDHAGTRLKPILLITYHLGMRLGEILNLTWDIVDLQGGGYFIIGERYQKPGVSPGAFDGKCSTCSNRFV